MKILLIVEKEETRQILETHLRPRGFEFIIYRNPIKAMDNIDEIDPDIVLFSAEDFPRHWKPFVHMLRESHSKDKTVVILLIGDVFPFEEAAKAVHLQVNGIIGEDFRDSRKMMHIEGLLSRYKMIKDNRRNPRYFPDNFDEIEFMFTHPDTLKLITGVINNVSPEGVSFQPDSPHLTTDLEEDAEIPYCSLRVGDEILSLTSKVVRNSKDLALSFQEIPDGCEQMLLNYIENRPERELKSINNPEQITE